MPRGGLTGNFCNKWIFGPGGNNIVVNSAACIYNVTGYTNLYTSPQDIICKNLTVSSTLLPTYFTDLGGQLDPKYATFKIICSGTLTLNTGGEIRVDGNIINGDTVPTIVGGCGYGLISSSVSEQPYGTLGGSGNGGIGENSSNGNNGGLCTAYGLQNSKIHLGGPGAVGNGLDGFTGGNGAVTTFNKQFNNQFQASVWQEAAVYDFQIKNVAVGCFPTFTEVAFMAPYRICGGGGGGGAGGSTGNTGGGGAGGGVCYIAADKLVFNGGSINADGQTAGPGGGGGGGVIIIVASTIEWTDASIGVSSAHAASGGANTSSANNGRVLVFTDDLVAEFIGGMDYASYITALEAYKSDK